MGGNVPRGMREQLSLGVRARHDVVYHRLSTLKFFGAQAVFWSDSKNVDEKAGLIELRPSRAKSHRDIPTLLLSFFRIYSRFQADVALRTLPMTSTGKSSR